MCICFTVDTLSYHSCNAPFYRILSHNAFVSPVVFLIPFSVQEESETDSFQGPGGTSAAANGTMKAACKSLDKGSVSDEDIMPSKVPKVSLAM